MALLRSRDDALHVPLSGHDLVGRSRSCAVSVRDKRVSSEHARILWDGERWTLRDLGSTNGTWVAGRQLRPGETVGIHQGSEICFGSLELSFLLAVAGPPAPVARNLDDGSYREADDGVLVLPHEDAPEVLVFEAADGRWVMEQDHQAAPVDHDTVLDVAGARWQVLVPEALDPTVATRTEGVELAEVDLTFKVSDDEERVALDLSHPGGTEHIRPRAHLYTLLTLARLRADDTDATEGQEGWVYADELCRMLAIDELRLNVEVYRCRKELGKLGIRGSAGVIERHRGTRQLRCGTPRVAFTRL